MTGIHINEAIPIAYKVFQALGPVSLGCAIVGAVRCHEPEIGLVEFLVEPKGIAQSNLLGEQNGFGYDIDSIETALNGAGVVNLTRLFGGFTGELSRGLKLCVYIHRYPEQWGLSLILYTGPKNFLNWALKQRRSGGALPSFAVFKDRLIKHGSKTVIMPDEPSVFAFLGVHFTQPEDRDSELEIIGSGGAMPYGAEKIKTVQA
jgi:hypothetical protein